MRLLGEAVITLAQQPVDHAEHKGCSSQRRNGAGGGGAGIENDEFATQRNERDEHNGLDLDDARAPKGNATIECLNSMAMSSVMIMPKSA